MKRFLLIAPLLLLGCSSTETSRRGGITITTVVPQTVETKGGKTSATWAAQREADGRWTQLTPISEGTYTVAASNGRWAIALACANNDSALVLVEEDVASVTSKEIMMSDLCATTGPDVSTLGGNLVNLPPNTGWLDFGYALESRGSALGEIQLTHEEVNVAAGTWDLAFGIRPTPVEPHSRIALLRGKTLAGDTTTLDVDLGSALVPNELPFVLHGIDPALDSTVNAPMYYATQGGKSGLDIGPQNIPLLAEARLGYSTIPPEAQQPEDRYRLFLRAGQNTEGEDLVDARGVLATFHNAVPIDLTLVPHLGQVTLTNVSVEPVIIEARTANRPTAASYELTVFGKISNRQSREWRIKISAALVEAEAVLTIPVFTEVPGWNPSWTLPAAQRRDVTLTMKEQAIPFSDGTIEHYAEHFEVLRPRQ